MQREQELRTREPSASVENIAHLLSATESKYEAKITDLKRINGTLEKERNDSEAEWSRKLKDRASEIEELKRLLGHSTKSQEKEEATIAELEEELEHERGKVATLQGELTDMAKTCSRLESGQVGVIPSMSLFVLNTFQRPLHRLPPTSFRLRLLS